MDLKNNILYIDDEEHNIIAFKATFRKNYNILTATTASQGIEILNDNSVQVVISDQRMPGMTGVQFLQKIIPNHPYCIRMILTGFSDIEAIIEAINTGQVFRYITKPWDNDELKMTIDAALQLYNVQDQNRLLINQLQLKTIEQEKIIEERTKDIVEKNKFLEAKNIEVIQKNKDITDSIEYAKRIQEALLKEEEHISKHLPEHFILFKPKDIVSGDFYWASEKQGYWYLAAVDCTGHGVPGAFMSMLGISFLNEIISSEQLLTPDKILNQLNDKIVKELKQTGEIGGSKDGMDISIIRLNLKTNELQWAGANNALNIVRQGKLEEIKADKQPVGYYPVTKPFTNHEFQLQKGDIIYIFSDGYADQFGGPKGKKFKTKQLEDLLTANNHKSMSEQKNILYKSFIEWKGSGEQVDDVCVIGVRV